MEMDEFLKKIAERSKKAIPKNDGDYIKNGILYCGKCNTPKQGKYLICNETYIMPPILCKCEEERIEKEKAEIAERERKERIERLRIKGIQDKKLLNCSFDVDNTPHSKQSAAFRRYCDKWEQIRKDNIGLILYGDVGTGKSFYAGCIANEIIKRYAIPVIVTSIPRILNEIFNTSDKNEYVRRLANVPLLVIDDLGAERETDYALEQIYTLIDERYKAEKPLIVTTNLSLQELKNPTDIIYKRIYDRVCEMTVPFNITGISRREEKAKEKKRQARLLLFDDEF